jgi:S-(hydroxymethyl)glutathione dehydrogenase/alcohol dehydrogenase
MFFGEKSLLGSYYGGADVRTEFHRLIRLWKAGRLDLDGMVSSRLTLDQANDGIEALKKGAIIRQVINVG